MLFLGFLASGFGPTGLGQVGGAGAFERVGFFWGPGFLLGRWGVLVPLDEAPDDCLEGLAFSTSDSAGFLSFSFLRSSSLRRSVSVSSDSDCGAVSR